VHAGWSLYQRQKSEGIGATKVVPTVMLYTRWVMLHTLCVALDARCSITGEITAMTSTQSEFAAIAAWEHRGEGGEVDEVTGSFKLARRQSRESQQSGERGHAE
jgi:hypothetical protein